MGVKMPSVAAKPSIGGIFATLSFFCSDYPSLFVIERKGVGPEKQGFLRNSIIAGGEVVGRLRAREFPVKMLLLPELRRRVVND
jgi:hypothetical protein